MLGAVVSILPFLRYALGPLHIADSTHYVRLVSLPDRNKNNHISAEMCHSCIAFWKRRIFGRVFTYVLGRIIRPPR